MTEITENCAELDNLYNETVEKFKDIKKTEKDVKWIGTKDGKFAVDWKTFAKISKICYDSGFGSQEIPYNLVVVFKDKTYLRRGTYDGSEWWEYIIFPTKMKNANRFKFVKVDNVYDVEIEDVR